MDNLDVVKSIHNIPANVTFTLFVGSEADSLTDFYWNAYVLYQKLKIIKNDATDYIKLSKNIGGEHNACRTLTVIQSVFDKINTFNSIKNN